MIVEVIADIGQKVKAQLPWVVDVQSIARQDPTGIIVFFDPEQWVGIDDRETGRMYVRYRDGWDALFSDARLTSVQDTTATYRMRAVFMHTCTNEDDIARFLSYSIMGATNYELRYAVRLRSVSTDKQFIVKQEMKTPDEQSGVPNDNLRLVMVDFDVTMRDSVLNGTECIPPCNGC